MKKRKLMVGVVLATAVLGLASCKKNRKPDEPVDPNPPVEQTKFNITYVTNGHGTQPDAVTDVNVIPTLPTMADDGDWTFGGWYMDQACTQKAIAGTSITENTTLYAKWTQKAVTPETYSITYVTEHGTAPAKVEGATKLPETLPVLEDADYDFGGWFTNEARTEAAVAGATISANATLYAKWTPKAETPDTYKITYLTDKGTAPAEVSGVTALPAELPTLTEEGWTFIGWFTDEERTIAAVAGATISENTTLYAKWVEVIPGTYSITYVTEHGTAPQIVTGVTALPATLPTMESVDGYAFAGWFTDEARTVAAVAEATIEANTTLYAKWTEIVPTGVVLNIHDADVEIGRVIDLRATISPTNALNKSVVWSSENDDIATVDQDGHVTGVAVGTVTITATTANGVTDSCEVTVLPETVHAESIAITVGNGTDRVTLTPTHTTETLTASVLPLDTTDKPVVWTSSDPNVAKVEATNADGTEAVVTLVTAGDAPITITATAGNVSASVFCTADTLYGELVNDREHLVLNENFVNYATDDKLPEWNGVWGTAGVYGAASGDGATYDETNYMKIITEANGNNRADMVDVIDVSGTDPKGATKLIVDFGSSLDGVIKGYVNVKAANMGNSWTLIQFYGIDAAKPAGGEIFGLRTNSGKLNYRVDGGAVKADGIITQVDYTDKGNATYRLYYEFDLSKGTVSIKINSNDFIKNLNIGVTEMQGVQFVSSNSGARTMSLDNIAVSNIPLSADEAKTATLAQLEGEYGKYVETNYAPEKWEELGTIYHTAVADINAAETKEDIYRLYDAAVEAMKGVEDIATTELNVAKQEALDGIAQWEEEVVDAFTINLEQMTTVLEQGKLDIASAQSLEELNTIMTALNEAVLAIPDDTSVIQTARETAVDDLNAAFNPDEYLINGDALTAKITEWTAQINEVTADTPALTVEAITAKLAEAIEDITATVEKDPENIDDPEVLNNIKNTAKESLAEEARTIKADMHNTTYEGKIDVALSEGNDSINQASTLKEINTALTAAKDAMADIATELENASFTVTLAGTNDTLSVQYGNKVTMSDLHVTAKNILSATYNGTNISEAEVIVYDNLTIDVEVEDIEGFIPSKNWAAPTTIENTTDGDAVDVVIESNSLFDLTSKSAGTYFGATVTVSGEDYKSGWRSADIAKSYTEEDALVLNIKENLQTFNLILGLADSKFTSNRSGVITVKVNGVVADTASGTSTKLSKAFTLTNLKVGDVVSVTCENKTAEYGARLWLFGVSTAIDETKVAEEVSIQWGEGTDAVTYHYYDAITHADAEGTGVFLGWYYMENDTEVKFEEGVKFASGTSIVMTPKFATSNVTITYNVEGVETPESYYVAEGTTGIEAPADPEKDGYKFLGWYTGTTADDTKFDFTAVEPDTAVTLYAKFEEIQPVSDSADYTAPHTDGKTINITSTDEYFTVTSTGNFSLSGSALQATGNGRTVIITASENITKITITVRLSLGDGNGLTTKSGTINVTGAVTDSKESNKAAVDMTVTLKAGESVTFTPSTGRIAFYSATATVWPK